MVLCGCRADSRSDIEVISYLADAHKLPITTEQAIKASQYISATAFVETSSSFMNQGVNEAFEVAVDAALELLNENNSSPKKVRSLYLKWDQIELVQCMIYNLFTEKVLGESKSDPNENQQIASNQKQHWQSWKELLHHVTNIYDESFKIIYLVASHQYTQIHTQGKLFLVWYSILNTMALETIVHRKFHSVIRVVELRGSDFMSRQEV